MQSLFDLFISYPKNSKWKSIISNIQFELRNKYKINYWVDYEQTEINSDLLKQNKSGIQKSSLFLCFLNQDYLTSYNCSEELKHAIKLEKEKIIILLDKESEKNLSALMPNHDDYVRINAYKDLNSFQICKGEYFQTLVDLLVGLLQSNEEAVNEERSIMDINNSLKIVITPELHDNDREKLVMFLESVRKSGGGEILNHEFRNKNYILYLTYKNYETKQRILSAKNIQFQNYSLLVYDGDEFINEDEVTRGESNETPVSDGNKRSKNSSPFRAKMSKGLQSKADILKQNRNVEKLTEFEKKHWLMILLQNHRYSKDTPHHAAFNGDMETMGKLLQDGGDVNAEDGWKMTALHIAANVGQFDFLRYLLKKNANINKQAFNGFTPLHMACVRSFDLDEKSVKKQQTETQDDSVNATIVEYLCTKGASLLRCNKGWLPFHYACFYDMATVLTFFFSKNLNVDEVTGNEQTALHLACLKSDKTLVKRLVSKGANVNKQDVYGRTCLQIASRKGDLGIVKFLFQKKANLNAKNGNGETALHYACWNGHEEIVRYLVLNNADTNSQTDVGETPLHYASRRNYYNIVEELLHNGALVELEDINQKTAITIAAKYARYPVEALLRSFETL